MSECPSCGAPIKRWRKSFWWMNDNHTFVRLTGTPIEMANQAIKACADYGSGMLCPPRFISDDPHEERQTKIQPVSSYSGSGKLDEDELRAWVAAVSALGDEP